MLISSLFAGDMLLEAIVENVGGQPRISTTQNRYDPAVQKVQTALLLWDATCLPQFGADGDFGNETAAAVHRFKVTALLVDEATVIDDVGPETVIHLDAIAFTRDQELASAARVAELDGLLGVALSGLSSEVSSSEVIAHTTGESALASLSSALSACVDDQAVVVISGWDFQESCPVAPGVTIGDALLAAATRGAMVRALFNHFLVFTLPVIGDWRPMDVNNDHAVAFINGLPGGAAIHDAKVLHHSALNLGLPPFGIPDVQVGVHHMKAWAVWTGSQLTAWCGGMDIHPNRVGSSSIHDVQLQVNGPAATAIYDVLRERWEDHPDRPTAVHLPVLIPNPAAATHRARVVTTFGNPTHYAGLNAPPYVFAPTGSTAYRELLFEMISQAKNFIYVEDQYFVDESVAEHLALQMSRLQALIVLICDSTRVNGELSQAFARRRITFDHLLPHSAKVAVAVRSDKFVHSKTWIFDDNTALVGSANVNRRGFEHDSEMGVAFADINGLGTARDLRERLWNLHLGTNAPVAGTDAVAALGLWQTPLAGSPIRRYDWTVGTDPDPVPLKARLAFTTDHFWDFIVDPAG